MKDKEQGKSLSGKGHGLKDKVTHSKEENLGLMRCLTESSGDWSKFWK